MDLVSEEQRTTTHAHNTLDFSRTKSLLFLVRMVLASDIFGWCLLPGNQALLHCQYATMKSAESKVYAGTVQKGAALMQLEK